MGAIRKTLSVATLGIINFRSKSEILARTQEERDLAVAASSRADERSEKLSRRLNRAEKRAQKAELQALGESKRARRERRRAERSSRSPLVDTADGAVVAGRRAKRKAKKLAASAQDEIQHAAETVAEKVGVDGGSR